MKHSIFNRSSTVLVAFVFITTSAVAPVMVRTANAQSTSGFDVIGMTEGMSGLQDLLGIGTACLLAPAMTDGISYLTGEVQSLLGASSIVPKSPTQTTADSARTVAATTQAGALTAAGEALGEAGVSIPVSVPTSNLPISQSLMAISASLSAIHASQEAIAVDAKASEEQKKGDYTVTDCLVYNAGQMMLNQLTNNIVSWIQGGFNGSPSFTIDTHKVFLDLADMVAGDLARELRGIAMCDFRVNFKNDLANTVELSAKRQYKFAGKAKCPFPETFNLSSSDFYKGVNKFSWAGMEYAMQDSGNPFGIAMLTGEELAARSSEKADVRKQELSWSNGFTNMVDTNNCNYPEGVDLDDTDLATGEPVYSDAAKREFQKTYCKTTTPGRIVGDQLSKSTGIDMDRLGLVDNVNKIVAALIDQITKKAAEGIFCAVGGGEGCDNETPTDYVTAAEKTAETVAMENAAIQPYYDAWQAEIQKEADANEELASLQAELTDAQAANEPLSTITDLNLKIEEQQAIIDAAPEKIATAKAAYDDASTPERSIARQQELRDAQSGPDGVDVALEAKKTAEYNAIRAQEAYYRALITEDAGTVAGLKQEMDEANAALAAARAELQIANERLYDAQHPAYSPPAE